MWFRRILCIALALACVLPISINSYSHTTQDEHDKEFEMVIFENDYMKNASYSCKQRVKYIEKAIALTTDQSNSNGQDKLDALISLGVPNLPGTVSQISISNHRYSHRGWDYDYDRSQVNWKDRKGILLSTVNHEVKFKGVSNRLTNYSKECDSLSALFYYVHIIGDHEDQKTWSKSQGNTSDSLIALGGVKDTNGTDIISELLKHSEVLFGNISSKEGKKNYKAYVKQLKKLDKNLEKLYDSSNKASDAKKIKELNSSAEELITIMAKYLPGLLRELDYFNDSFYVDYAM